MAKKRRAGEGTVELMSGQGVGARAMEPGGDPQQGQNQQLQQQQEGIISRVKGIQDRAGRTQVLFRSFQSARH